MGTIVIVLGGCGPEPDAPGCLTDTPSELGRVCVADGECGNWLMCSAETCALPPAVAGEGGRTLEVQSVDGSLRSLKVELAQGDLQRERGLAHRPCIEPGWGMMLEFPSADDHLISTAAMRFDLDLAFAGPDMVVHTVHRNAAAGDSTLFGASEPVGFVVETVAGTFEIASGDRLTLR